MNTAKEKRMRYIPQNLIMQEASPVCQKWSYPSCHPMEAMIEKDYFISGYEQLRPGDSIRIVQMRDANIHSRSNVVVAFCDTIVIQSGRDGVFLYPGEIVVIKDKPIAKPILEQKVGWNPGKKEYEVKVGDNVVFSSKDKAEAESWAG